MGGIPLDARIKDDTPEMLKNLWKTRITRGGWFPTSTIDPHGIHEGTRKSFCQDTATPWYSCQVPWTSLSVCYTLRIDRVTRRASSRDLSSQNKTTSSLLFNPGAAWRALVSILFSYKIVIHVCEFVLSIFFSFFFFHKLKNLETTSRESVEIEARTCTTRGCILIS